MKTPVGREEDSFSADSSKDERGNIGTSFVCRVLDERALLRGNKLQAHDLTKVIELIAQILFRDAPRLHIGHKKCFDVCVRHRIGRVITQLDKSI